MLPLQSAIDDARAEREREWREQAEAEYQELRDREIMRYLREWKKAQVRDG